MSATATVSEASPASITPGLPRPSRVRWIAVAICFLYGFAKINESQFTVLDSEVSKPMGEVSGFWLTWYYFGYSSAYGNLIARHADRLRAVLLLDGVRRGSGLRAATILLMLAGAGGFTWWVANYNNISPTAIDGTWVVVPSEGSSASQWQEVFFERNRAFWVTFRSADRADEIHHFEVDDAGVVRVWETWLRKGRLLMEGRVGQDGRLQLRPIDPSAVPLVLVRSAQPRS